MIARISLIFTLVVFAFFTSGFDEFANEILIKLNLIINRDFIDFQDGGWLWPSIAKFVTIIGIILISEILNGLYRILFQKPFYKIHPHISKLQAKYAEKFPKKIATDEDYMIFLSEVRGIFCKYFRSNEISVTLFKVIHDPQMPACETFISADVDGFVGRTQILRKFEEGEGFIGESLKIADMYFGSKKRFIFFDNPKFKKFKRDNHSSSFSFWCFPIFSSDVATKENICLMLCIETDRSKYFNYIAKRDEYSKNIRNNIDITLRNMYISRNE